MNRLRSASFPRREKYTEAAGRMAASTTSCQRVGDEELAPLLLVGKGASRFEARLFNAMTRKGC